MSFYSKSSGQWMDDSLAAMRLVMPDVLERERHVASKKWFAYRFMTPLAATKLFAALYRDGFKAYIRAHKDRDEAERSNGVSPFIFDKPSGSLTQLWKARQRADELGLPYNLLVDFGFHFAGRRRRRRAPRPMQLFGSKAADIAWPLEIEKYLADHLPRAVDSLRDLPQYRAEHYRALAVQDEFRAYLVEHIRSSLKPWAMRLATPCVRERYLPLLIGLKLAPDGLYRGILSEIRNDRDIGMLEAAENEKLAEVAFVPACFGLPPAEAKCNNGCPISASCRRASTLIAAELVSRDGSISRLKDARDIKRKEAQRIRTARFRAKKSASVAAPAGVP